MESLYARSAQVEAPDDRIDSTIWTLRLPVTAFLEEGVLGRLIDLPMRFAVAVELDAGEVRVEGPRYGEPTVTWEGEIHTAIDGDDLSALEGAASRDDAEAALRLLTEREAETTLEVVNEPAKTGIRWIRSKDSLLERLAASWLATLQAIFSEGRPETLVVADAGDGSLRAGSLRVCGPAAAPWQGEWPTGAQAEWWEEHHGGEPSLPAPAGIVPGERDGEGLEEIEPMLVGIARALAWLWLADAVDASRDIPRVQFVGQRVVDVVLETTPADSASDEIALWGWATGEPDPGRYQAVQQAIALAVFSESDLPHAARPALRTADTLLKALRENQLAEAMATRRSVRDAAIGAGRAAADAGRAAGAKSLERLVVQAAATAGILIAQSGDALSGAATSRLLLLIGMLLIASGAIAVLVDYPTAYGILRSFKQDLYLNRDTLSEEDIEEIESMESLKEAHRKITASCVITVVVLLIALGALGVALASTCHSN